MNEDNCLWMGDIDPIMDESIIRTFFQFYNFNPINIRLIKNNEENKKKTYCFVYFKNIYEANRILNQLNGKPIPNTSLKFKLNWANYITSDIKIIFVGNLNPLVDDISLLNFFKSKYKSVSKAKVITENGKSKRYGFVTFKKGNDYRKCLIEMNGVFFEGTNIRVKEYIKKDEGENENVKNIQQNIKSNITNNQPKLYNKINNINNCIKLLKTNNFNSSNFLYFSSQINKINWINNANPIEDVNIGINHNNDITINSKNKWFNQNKSVNNYEEKNNKIKFNNCNNCISECNIFINNVNNVYKKDNIINNKINKSKNSKVQKLEILEEFDEKTLMIKIKENLDKMLKYYKESLLISGNKIVSMLFYFIFKIYIVSNVFKYYCNVPYFFCEKKSK